MQLVTKSVQATAIGYLYLDDGITNADITRIDFYLSNNEDNTFTFDKTIVASLQGKKRGLQHETIGTITFLYASKNGM